MAFPPPISYPLALDTDRTLFLVYNTTQARLAANNEPFASEIEIVPVGADDDEIWAENGFANIDGELFYYDDVETDSNGKVYLLKKCARNLGGSRTKFCRAVPEEIYGFPNQKKGIFVMGMVVAEHHNQLADATIAIETFVLTLDGTITELMDESICLDDHRCPDIVFNFEIDESSSDSSCEGTVALFEVTIDGSFTSYRLDFGDGSSTTDLSGTHIYGPSTKIDPVVRVANADCEIVQTPPIRPEESQDETLPDQNGDQFSGNNSLTPPPIDIPVPDVPAFPNIDIPEINLPETTLTLPQIVTPFVDIGPISGFEIPSVIMIEPPLELPSVISFTPIDIPSLISITPIDVPSTITITPSVISLTPAIPSIISLTPVIPSIINVIDDIPSVISVDWGTVPTISVCVTLRCPSTVSGAMWSGLGMGPQYITNDPIYDTLDDVDVGIPSEINVIAPETLPDVRLVHELPEEIKLSVPKAIRIDATDIPENIQLTIPNDAAIRLDVSDLPPFLEVRGIPDIISVVGNIPTEIIHKFEIPENLEVPLVYRGGPIPIQWDATNLPTDKSKAPCFMLLPCNPE